MSRVYVAPLRSYLPFWSLVRSAVSIVPQSPDLFEGTLRENIDPVGQHEDHDIWIALGQVCGIPPIVSEASSQTSTVASQRVCWRSPGRFGRSSTRRRAFTFFRSKTITLLCKSIITQGMFYLLHPIPETGDRHLTAWFASVQNSCPWWRYLCRWYRLLRAIRWCQMYSHICSWFRHGSCDPGDYPWTLIQRCNDVYDRVSTLT